MEAGRKGSEGLIGLALKSGEWVVGVKRGGMQGFEVVERAVLRFVESIE